MTISVREKQRKLAVALAEAGGGSMEYIGGGDFIVHINGIDPQIDEAIEQFEACRPDLPAR
jgi:hypothetical protein